MASATITPATISHLVIELIGVLSPIVGGLAGGSVGGGIGAPAGGGGAGVGAGGVWVGVGVGLSCGSINKPHLSYIYIVTPQSISKQELRAAPACPPSEPVAPPSLLANRGVASCGARHCISIYSLLKLLAGALRFIQTRDSCRVHFL